MAFVFVEAGAAYLARPNLVELGQDQPFLLETSWHQVGDYAQFIPDGEIAGCWSTAVAQIGAYHGLKPTGTIEYRTSAGLEIREDLGSYAFTPSLFSANMDENTSEASKQQIAKYIYLIATVIHKDFAGDGYLHHDTFVERLEEHLGCSAEFHEFDKEGFLRSRPSIESLVRTEIDAGRPLMIYFDNGKDFGHAAVLDGYTEQNDAFLVHLNMGWGGRHDGWYDLFGRFIGVRDDLQTRFLVTIQP
jgi:hypothetical protein